jgi:F-type H+-transporting ATPase subunit alpha
MPVEEQVVSIFTGTKGYLDDIAVGDVRRFENELLDHMRTRHSSVLSGIRQDPKADVPKDLADIVKSFKASFVTSSASASADPTATSARNGVTKWLAVKSAFCADEFVPCRRRRKLHVQWS